MGSKHHSNTKDKTFLQQRKQLVYIIITSKSTPLVDISRGRIDIRQYVSFFNTILMELQHIFVTYKEMTRGRKVISILFQSIGIKVHGPISPSTFFQCRSFV